jgi:hypothetical protein
MVSKSYRYNKFGKLTVIFTRKPGSPVEWQRVECLYYDRAGNMVKKMVKESNVRPYYFSYEYDNLNRLVRIRGYRDESSALRFICGLFYDAEDNIEKIEFYYPTPLASSVNDVIRKWVVYYNYDKFHNPFRDLKLPVHTLFEWMDLISPANISSISFDNGTVDRSVFYKYRYNNSGYPVIRYRVSPFSVNE